MLRALLRLSPIDWGVVLYLLPFGVATLVTARAGLADSLVLTPLLSLGGYLLLAWYFRTRASRGRLLETLYHLLVIPALAFTYFRLREIVPMVNGSSADPGLAALDLWLFGGHASVWLERWASRGTVEFFAFFYQLYMVLGAGFILGEIFFDRDRERQARFGLGILLVLGAHVLYLLVPARGPLVHLLSLYQGPLPGGPLHRLVVHSQEHGGPLFDAFPSLHTAVTVFLLLHVWRSFPAWRWPLAATPVCILISTVFLRYHYLIDLLAGLLLAAVAFWGGAWLLRAYGRWQAAAGLHLPPW